MTQAEILTKAIQKAMQNGFQEFSAYSFVDGKIHFSHGDFTTYYSTSDLLFNHDFAKALWGQEKKEWLGGFTWYSLYEQDGYSFKNAQEVLDSWLYSGGEPENTVEDLESLSPDGIRVCGGLIEKKIEITNKGFKYHLQQMVIAEDPIKYLGENLDH